MKDEKILEDELMTDDELEQVAGGTLKDDEKILNNEQIDKVTGGNLNLTTILGGLAEWLPKEED